MSDIKSNLSNAIWKIADVLSADGIGNTDYLTQLTYALFLKMDSERVELLGQQSLIPEGFRWADLTALEGESLLRKYEAVLSKLSLEKGLVGNIFSRAHNKISRPANLKKMLAFIGDNQWLTLDTDLKGAIYEEILEKNGKDSKSGAGQYFTPRPLIQAMVEVIRPRITETVCDPACGTGGFLLAAYSYMQKQSQNVDKLRFLRTEALHGVDNTDMVVTMASMNLYLHGLDATSSPIECRDSLQTPPQKLMDVILTNPPFGARPSGTVELVRDDFYATTKNNELNFLQHIMLSLKEGGRAAVVLPTSVLTQNGNAQITIRRQLLDNFDLHTILHMPQGLFYAGIETDVIFFTKGRPTKAVWVYDYREGIKHTKTKNQLKRENLDDFVLCYNADDITKRRQTYHPEENPNGRWRRYDIEEIRARDGFNLDLSWIKMPSQEDTDLSINELLAQLQAESSSIADAVKKLQTIISNLQQ